MTNKKEFEVYFRIVKGREYCGKTQMVGRVKVTCRGQVTPREVFEHECQRYGHGNWHYLNAFKLEGNHDAR